MEPLNIYFANTGSTQANKNLDFTKAHHFVFAYDFNIAEKLHLKLETYYQYLYDIPAIENSKTSLINLKNDWFINDAYRNIGKGQNYGIDLILEQYINNGFYYLLSASIFESKYNTDSQKWYNTRFNKNFLFNVLFGKEFRIGKEKQNLLGLNLRTSIQGGDRYSPVDSNASITEQDVVYNDESTPFSEQAKPSFISHFTINYEWYKHKKTHKLSLKVLNATNFKEFQGHRFNFNTNTVEEFREALIIPNISYKVSF